MEKLFPAQTASNARAFSGQCLVLSWCWAGAREKGGGVKYSGNTSFIATGTGAAAAGWVGFNILYRFVEVGFFIWCLEQEKVFCFCGTYGVENVFVGS